MGYKFYPQRRWIDQRQVNFDSRVTCKVVVFVSCWPKVKDSIWSAQSGRSSSERSVHSSANFHRCSLNDVVVMANLPALLVNLPILSFDACNQPSDFKKSERNTTFARLQRVILCHGGLWLISVNSKTIKLLRGTHLCMHFSTNDELTKMTHVVRPSRPGDCPSFETQGFDSKDLLYGWDLLWSWPMENRIREVCYLTKAMFCCWLALSTLLTTKRIHLCLLQIGVKKKGSQRAESDCFDHYCRWETQIKDSIRIRAKG